MTNKKDNSLFGLILAGVAAAIAAVVGFNELSKSKSSWNKGSGSPTAGAGNTFGYPPKKSGGCGCGA